MPTRWATSFFNRNLLPWTLLNLAFRTEELYRAASNRRLFSTLTVRSNFITGTGHGKQDAYAGQYKAILWQIGQYSPSEVEGKIIKLLSCECGLLLGPDLIENGAKAFQGYNKTFAFFVDAKHMLIPWLDPVGAGFLKPVTEGIRAFLEGKTNKEAYQLEYDLHTESMEAETDPELKDWKKHNRDSLVMLGDPDARLTETAAVFPLLSRLGIRDL